jgi:hypothetical protein
MVVRPYLRRSRMTAVILMLFATSCVNDHFPDTFRVEIVNDTHQSVHVEACGTNCDEIEETFTLSPDDRASVNASLADVDEYFEVFSPTGEKIGCLNLRFSKPEYGKRVFVSDIGKCP